MFLDLFPTLCLGTTKAQNSKIKWTHLFCLFIYSINSFVEANVLIILSVVYSLSIIFLYLYSRIWVCVLSLVHTCCYSDRWSHSHFQRVEPKLFKLVRITPSSLWVASQWMGSESNCCNRDIGGSSWETSMKGFLIPQRALEERSTVSSGHFLAWLISQKPSFQLMGVSNQSCIQLWEKQSSENHWDLRLLQPLDC